MWALGQTSDPKEAKRLLKTNIAGELTPRTLPQEKTVYVCDLCKEQGEPQCVKWCPEEALTVVTSDVLAQKARLAAIKKLFQQQKKQ